jgi:hypothetical protein
MPVILNHNLNWYRAHSKIMRDSQKEEESTVTQKHDEQRGGPERSSELRQPPLRVWVPKEFE